MDRPAMVQALRPAAVALYRKIGHRLPSVVRLYRNAVHREMQPPFRRKYAIGELHEAIKREYHHHRGGFFFEAGANDGLLFSNTAYLERYWGWKGVLVEAVPHKFVECIHNRPGAVVEHCALVSPEYDKSYVEIHYSNLMSFAPMVTHIDKKKQIDLGYEFLIGDERVLSDQKFLAPASTIEAILARHDVRRVDFMVLDLEGAELEALKGLNFDTCRVDTILIEVRDIDAIDGFLIARGYRRHAQWSESDYLYRFG